MKALHLRGLEVIKVKMHSLALAGGRGNWRKLKLKQKSMKAKDRSEGRRNSEGVGSTGRQGRSFSDI